MRKKLLRITLIVLGVSGFFLGNHAIYLGDINNPAWFITCLVAIMLLSLSLVGMSLYNYLESVELSLTMSRWERKKRKRLGLVTH